jgi:hypothetical protein
MAIIESALLLGLSKSLGLTGILAKLGLILKAGAAKTMMGKAGADIGLLLGLAGGAVIADVLFEKAANVVNAHLKANNYDIRISPSILKVAKSVIAGIDSHSWAHYAEEVVNGTIEEFFAVALHQHGFDKQLAAASSIGLIQIAQWQYEAQR